MTYFPRCIATIQITISTLSTIPNKVLTVCLLLLALAWSTQSYAQAGHYESNSESEWVLSLWLSEDGRALKVFEQWLAGQYDDRRTVIDRGQWTKETDTVTVHYGDNQESYVILEQANMKEEGLERLCPRALQENGPQGHVLWLKECLTHDLTQ